MRWQTVIGIMAAVYIANRLFGWAYDVWPFIDIPMHILGGFLAACLGLGLWQAVVKRHKTKGVPPYAVMIVLVSFAGLIAVVWEFHEFIADWNQAREGDAFRMMQASVADTVKDLADGLIGACIAVLLFRKQLSSNNNKRIVS